MTWGVIDLHLTGRRLSIQSSKSDSKGSSFAFIRFVSNELLEQTLRVGLPWLRGWSWGFSQTVVLLSHGSV